jgi:hypothetical protein
MVSKEGQADRKMEANYQKFGSQTLTIVAV